jgi:hypothetical protein
MEEITQLYTQKGYDHEQNIFLKNSLLESRHILKEILLLNKRKFLFFKKWRLRILNSRLEKVEKRIFEQIDLYLLEHDAEYTQIASNNLSLFSKKKMKFNVFAHIAASNNQYTKKLKGSLHRNGAIYLTENDSSWITKRSNFDTQFPSKFVGKINHWGKVELETVSVKRKWFKKLPSEYIGAIDEHGNVELHIVEEKNEIDLVSGGSLCIGKLIGDLFVGNESQIISFQNNVKTMLDKISSFKEQASEGKH